MSSHVVANALGHRSPAVTHAHYIQPSTQKRMSTKRVDKLAEPVPHWIAASSASESGNKIDPICFRTREKAFASFSRARKPWCDRGDSNPHGVTHWNLKTAML